MSNKTLKNGDRVFHPNFGHGDVIELMPPFTRVKFDNGATNIVTTSFLTKMSNKTDIVPRKGKNND